MNARGTILLLLLCPALTGCESIHSFFQLNSDSPLPFFGLSLDVDANEAQQRQLQQSAAKRLDGDFSGTLDGQQLHANFELTGKQRVDSGDIRYTLQPVTAARESQVDAEIADVLSRM